MLRKYVYVTVACIYASVIFYLSSLSSPPNPINYIFLMNVYKRMVELGINFLAYPFYIAYLHPDKFAHTMLYMGFGLTLNPAVRYTIGKYPELLCIIIGSMYGITDEIHQIFVPFRTASAMDLMADVVGLIISQAIILTIAFFKKRVRG